MNTDTPLESDGPGRPKDLTNPRRPMDFVIEFTVRDRNISEEVLMTGFHCVRGDLQRALNYAIRSKDPKGLELARHFVAQAILQS